MKNLVILGFGVLASTIVAESTFANDLCGHLFQYNAKSKREEIAATICVQNSTGSNQKYFIIEQGAMKINQIAVLRDIEAASQNEEGLGIAQRNAHWLNLVGKKYYKESSIELNLEQNMHVKCNQPSNPKVPTVCYYSILGSAYMKSQIYGARKFRLYLETEDKKLAHELITPREVMNPIEGVQE